MLVLAGTAFRLIQYVAARSLWLDESMLALDIAARSWSELVLPLDYNQVAPPLFLWLGHLATTLAGTSEMSVRAWPMLSGLMIPPLLGLVAYRLFGPAAALVAVALASFSPTLVRYANEAKPYSSDAFVTTLLLAAAVAVRARPAAASRWAALAGLGVLAILLSIPSAFVLPAVLAALAVDVGAGTRRLRGLGAAAVTWAATLLAVYARIYRAAATNPYQQSGYSEAFLSPGSDLRGRVLLALRGTVWPSLAGNGSHIPRLPDWALAVVVVVLATGLVMVARRAGRAILILVGLPLVMVVLASVLRRYPLGVPRMMVFAAPLLILMLAAALAGLSAAASAYVRPSLLAATGLLCLAPLMGTRLAEARNPPPLEEARSLVEAFRDRPARGEPVYVAARGIPSWLFYTTKWSAPDRARLDFYARAASRGPSFENAAPRAHPVVEEGDALVYEYRGHQEILGLSSGRQWRWPDYVTSDVDAGWAANEARRIARAADPCAWMYFTHLSERANKPISWHLRDDFRGRVQTLIEAPGGVLYRYCFPRTPEQILRLEKWKEEREGAGAARTVSGPASPPPAPR